MNRLLININSKVIQNQNSENLEINDKEKETKFNPFKIPKTTLPLILWILLLPANILFYYTIPDVRRKVFDKFPFYLMSFIVSTFYVGTLTYGMIWMVVIIGKIVI